MFTFLLVVHALIAAVLVGVILMQRSEGGGLGMGGSPSGLMSARGAADFLTRATTVLASLFVLLSIGLAVLATRNAAPATIDTSLARQAPVPAQTGPAPGADPLAAAAGQATGGAPLATTSTPVAPASAPAEVKVGSSSTTKPAATPVIKSERKPAAPSQVQSPPVPLIRPTVPATGSAPAARSAAPVVPVAPTGNAN